MSLRIHLLHLFGLVIILFFHLDIKFFSSLIKVFFEKTVEVKTMVIIYVVFGGETRIGQAVVFKSIYILRVLVI